MMEFSGFGVYENIKKAIYKYRANQGIYHISYNFYAIFEKL